MELEDQAIWIQAMVQNNNNQNSMVLVQKQKCRSMEHDKVQRETHAPMGTSSLTKKAKIDNGEKTASSISGAGKAGELLVKE